MVSWGIVLDFVLNPGRKAYGLKRSLSVQSLGFIIVEVRGTGAEEVDDAQISGFRDDVNNGFSWTYKFLEGVWVAERGQEYR